MNKWAKYWMLHCVGFAGLGISLILLPYEYLPNYVMGLIGGFWMGLFMIIARLVVIASGEAEK